MTLEVEGETMAIRFTRTDQSDGATEILTIVQIEGKTDYAVEICSGPNVGDDFVGLYTLEGESIPFGNATWSATDARGAVDAALIAAVEDNFAHGNMIVEPYRP